MPVHDFATVRVYDMGDSLEIFFPKGDLATKDAVKSYRGRWDGQRFCWRIDAARSGKPLSEIIEGIRQAILAKAPDGWAASVEKMAAVCNVTRQFGVRFAEGGVRLELPRGHKHNWTLKEDSLATQDKDSWLIPASLFVDPKMQALVKDIVRDDQAALSKALDYLEGFQVCGDMDLAEGEMQSIGIEVGKIIAADTSFVRKVDAGMEAEPLTLYPLRVLAIEAKEQFHFARLAFVTGEEAYYYLRKVLDPRKDLPPCLDMRHATGKWVRRRT